MVTVGLARRLNLGAGALDALRVEEGHGVLGVQRDQLHMATRDHAVQLTGQEASGDQQPALERDRDEPPEEARRMGVVFARFEPEESPVVEVGDKISVRFKDLVMGDSMTVEADNLVLAAAVIPNDDNKELARLFKVSVNEDDYFLEAHMKLRPVDFATDGVFLAGLAHYPKPLDETIAQAEAAGSHAAAVLARGYVEAPGMVSVVDQFMCRGCGRCVDVCPFNAPQLKEIQPGVVVSEVNPALCKGCGACGVACPTGAAEIRHFKDDQIGDMIDAAMDEVEGL